MAVESVGGGSLAIGLVLSQGYRPASSRESVGPRVARLVARMPGRAWLTGTLIGPTAERITQDSPRAVVAAKPEGWRHDVS